MILQLLLLLSFFLAFTQALDITGSIQLNTHLISAALLPPSTLVTLSGPGLEYATHATADGKFTFHNVAAGHSYLLQVECLTHIFPPLRVDTENEDVEVYQTFRGNEWNHRGAKLAYPIQIAPSAKADYYLVQSL